MSVYANMRQFVHTNTARRAVSGGFLPCKKNWRRRRFCQASVWNAIRVRVTWFMALSKKTSRQTGAKEDDAFCYVRYSKQRRTVLPNISRALLDFFINNQSSLFCTRRSSFGFDSNFKAYMNYSLEMIGSTGKKVISFYTVHRKCWLAVSLFLFFQSFLSLSLTFRFPTFSSFIFEKSSKNASFTFSTWQSNVTNEIMQKIKYWTIANFQQL